MFVYYKNNVKTCETRFMKPRVRIKIVNSNDVLLRVRGWIFHDSSIYSYVFNTFYTSLPHNCIKEKYPMLIKYIFNSVGGEFIACYTAKAFFTKEFPENTLFEDDKN